MRIASTFFVKVSKLVFTRVPSFTLMTLARPLTIRSSPAGAFGCLLGDDLTFWPFYLEDFERKAAKEG